jgi:hypothetical protein
MTAQIVEERVHSPAHAAGRGRRPGVWRRVRQTVAEMNYASRRTVELQAPWITRDQTR